MHLVTGRFNTIHTIVRNLCYLLLRDSGRSSTRGLLGSVYGNVARVDAQTCNA